MAKIIPLSLGFISIVDDEDFGAVRQYRWFYSKGYAYRTICTRGEKHKHQSQMLHRFIIGLTEEPIIDHVNHDTLDNRRENLRPATKSQNGQNRKSGFRQSMTGVRNVYYEPKYQRYYVKIKVNHKNISLGSYTTVEQAAIAAAEGRKRFMTHAPECRVEKP